MYAWIRIVFSPTSCDKNVTINDFFIAVLCILKILLKTRKILNYYNVI